MKDFCSEHGLKYVTLSVFLRTMEELSSEVAPKVVVGKDGGETRFFSKLAKELDLGGFEAPNNADYAIPFTWARYLARLDRSDQAEFVRRWRRYSLPVSSTALKSLASAAKLLGFEGAYTQTFGTGKRAALVEQLILFGVLSSRLLKPGFFEAPSFSKEEVQAGFDSLCKKGLLKKARGTYEISDGLLDAIGTQWRNGSYAALSTWVKMMLGAMGALQVSNDAKTKAKMLKAIEEARLALEYYRRELEHPQPIGALLGRLKEPK